MTSVWNFDGFTARRMGLWDAEHTGPNGFQISHVGSLNNAGDATGSSDRFVLGNLAGQSSWVYSRGSNHRAGFVDAYHTSGTGEQISAVVGLNESGQAIGVSSSYPNASEQGQSAWIYSGGVTTRLGLTGPNYTSSTGLQYSNPMYLNNAGQVAGTSQPMTAGGGQTGWVWTAGSTAILGFTDAAHTDPAGQQWTDIDFLNDAGHATGESVRYDASGVNGSTAWYYNGATTTRIGIFDAQHTSVNGEQYSFASRMNAASQVAGSSTRYVPGVDDAGQSSWIYSNGVTTRTGLFDAQHTSASGIQYSTTALLNDAGVATGISDQYIGDSRAGDSAWIFSGGVTHEIGLVDASHTAPSGHQSNSVEYLNNAGHVVGSADEFVVGGVVGSSTWFYDGTSTVQIGLLDARHTRVDGYRYSTAQGLNDAGQAIGLALRFSDTDLTERGLSGWFYDHATNHTFPLVFSESSDGHAETVPGVISNEGVVLGTYRQYSENGSQLLPFYWSIADGFHALDDLVSGGLAANGWQLLESATLTINGSARFLVGTGFRDDGSTMAFRMALPGGGAWINPAGGNWQTGSNWNLGAAPTSGDDAIFNLPGAYAVSLSSDATAHDLTISAGSVSLHANGNRVGIGHTLNIKTAKLSLDGGQIKTVGVDITDNGKLDLTDAGSSLVVDYTGGTSSFAPIRSLIISGRNGGNWDGATGITSSAAAANHNKALGIADNVVLGRMTFGGHPVDPHNVLIMLTFSGDANLDGKVDVTDLGALATNWQTSSVWTGGDFNYDGFVDVTDLGALATNWQAGVTGGTPLSATSFDDALAAVGLSSATVPEPTHLLLGVVFGSLAIKPRLTRRA